MILPQYSTIMAYYLANITSAYAQWTPQGNISILPFDKSLLGSRVWNDSAQEHSERKQRQEPCWNALSHFAPAASVSRDVLLDSEDLPLLQSLWLNTISHPVSMWGRAGTAQPAHQCQSSSSPSEIWGGHLYLMSPLWWNIVCKGNH